MQLLMLSAFLLTGKSKRQNGTLIFRDSGRREVEFLLSYCKRGCSLEIKQSYNARYLINKFFAYCSYRHFAILRS